MQLRKILPILVFVLFVQNLNAQPFYRNYRDSLDTLNYIYCPTYCYNAGHGAMVVNTYPDSPYYRYNSIKLNERGDTEWVKRNWLDTTFTSPRIYYSSARGTVTTTTDTTFFAAWIDDIGRISSSGNYIVLTDNHFAGPGNCLFLWQIDSLGNKISSFVFVDTVFGDTIPRHDYFMYNRIIPCGNDSFYLIYNTNKTYHFTTGYSHCTYDSVSQITHILKMSSNYHIAWERQFEHTNIYPAAGGCPSFLTSSSFTTVNPISVCLTAEGGLAFLNVYDSSFVPLFSIRELYNRLFLHKLRPDGTTEWEVPITNSLSGPARSLLQVPRSIFPTHDSAVVCTIFTDDTLFSSARTNLLKFSPSVGALLDSVSTTCPPGTGITMGAELSTGKYIFVNQGLSEFDMFDNHLNFLSAVPYPFPENNFVYWWSTPGIIPNSYGGAFCAFPGGNPSYVSTFHSVFINFDSSFLCYPSNVKGSIIQDNNHDCTNNSGDLPIGMVCAKLHETATGTDYYGYTNDSGLYNANVPSGNYTVTHPVSRYENNECGGYTYAITTPITISNANFCDTITPGIRDLQLYLYTISCLVPGDTTELQVVAFNNGSQTADTTVNVILDSRSSFVSSIPAATYTSADTVRYRIHLLSDSTILFRIKIRTSTSATIGDTFAFAANSPFPNNIVPSNDSAYFNQAIVSSHDPNFIAVNQKLHFHRNNTMIYTAGFENTGTYRAKNVVVLDTVDAHLDPSSFRILHSSHGTPHVTWLNDHRVLFAFNNINLPDSMSNPSGSHGEFSYSIRTKATANIGDTVLATAYIYFDYNPPVITNTTTNILGWPSVLGITHVHNIDPDDILIYPNPATRSVSISLPGNSWEWSIKVADITGKQVAAYNYIGTKITLPIDWAPGLYLITISNATTGEHIVRKLSVER